MNIKNYSINEIKEVELNVYLVVYREKFFNKIKDDPPFKCFIVDATKDEQSASVRQISLPVYNDFKNIQIQ